MNDEKPGDLNRKSDKIAPKPAGDRASGPPAAQPVAEPETMHGHHSLTLQPGGRGAIAGTAEHIGSVLGAAQRQLRHGLELVHPSSEHHEPGRDLDEDVPTQGDEDFAGRMMQAIEDEVARIHREFTDRLISLQCPAMAQFQRLRDALHRLRRRIGRLVAENPVQVAAALAGICLTLAAALRLRRSHHV
jgi:hypothetical protein